MANNKLGVTKQMVVNFFQRRRKVEILLLKMTFFELISVLVAIGRIISKEFMTDLLKNTRFLLPVAVD